MMVNKKNSRKLIVLAINIFTIIKKINARYKKLKAAKYYLREIK